MKRCNYSENDLLHLKCKVIQLKQELVQKPQFIYAAFYLPDVKITYLKVLQFKFSNLYEIFKEVIDWLIEESINLYSLISKANISR